MPRLLESIKLENGVFHRLSYHEHRMHRAQRTLFGKVTIPHLADCLSAPTHARRGLYKCRIIYQQAFERVEYIPYSPTPIRTLRRVSCSTLAYDHKYEDRSLLNELFAQREDCDDVLIIRDGLVTDTSYANIIFYDGQRWVTPDHPLLAGTQREYLLKQGYVTAIPLKESDIHSFQWFQLINALLGVGQLPQPVCQIR